MRVKPTISPKQKLKAVRQVVDGKKSLNKASDELGISRQSLYLWVRKYRGNPKKGSSLFKSNYKAGKGHHKSVSWKVEKQILDLLVKYPTLSLRELTGRLRDSKVSISTHGVYNVLLRHELQTRELRVRFSEQRPVKTVLASEISAANRLKAIEQHLKVGVSITQVCKIWGVSRPTFYEWKRRYQEVSEVAKVTEVSNVVEALARRYKKGYENHRSVSRKVVEAILEIVRANPAYSVHKIYALVPKVAGRAIVGHHGIQNILSRENLSTFAKRLVFAGGFAPEPRVVVAPLYRPQIPVYRLRMILAPFASIPKLLITNPRAGISRLSFALVALFIIGAWFRMIVASQISAVGLVFASIALFFGLFFFIYSLKYYISILVILRLAQSGIGEKR